MGILIIKTKKEKMIDYEKVNRVLNDLESYLLRERDAICNDDTINYSAFSRLDHAIDSLEQCKANLSEFLGFLEEGKIFFNRF